MDIRELPSSDGSGQRHPWELARAQHFLDVLAGNGNLKTAATALDAGSGDAYFAHRLLAAAPTLERLCCWDEAYDDTLRQRLGVSDERIELSAHEPAGQFDLVLALDVLEHVEDDRRFLRDLVGHLNPDGAVLVSVPAWPELESNHDRLMLHHRRYSQRSFTALIESAGLRVVSGGGLFHSLIAPRWISTMLEKRHPPTTADSTVPPLSWNHGAAFSRGIYWLLRADTFLSRQAARHSIFVPGLSLWALCKPATA